MLEKAFLFNIRRILERNGLVLLEINGNAYNLIVYVKEVSSQNLFGFKTIIATSLFRLSDTLPTRIYIC
jgi:hypothetical protein